MDIRPLLLARRRRPLGETRPAKAALRAGRPTFEAPLDGRIGELLERLVPEVARPAQPVTHWLPDLVAEAPTIDALDLGARFEIVALASHLVNTPEDDARRALLRAAARHAVGRGRVLVEHHPVDWAETAAESWTERPGSRLGMVDVERRPPYVSAVSVYEVGPDVVRQPFTARVLSEVELAAELATAGLVTQRRLSPTWLEATRSR